MKLKSNKNNNQFIPKGSSACALGIIDNQLEMPSTPVENVLQISSFMQNKANSPNVQMNLTYLTTRNYTIFASLTKVKNKPNTNPIKAKTNPIQTQLLQRAKLMQSVYLQRIMKKTRIWAMKKQTQFFTLDVSSLAFLSGANPIFVFEYDRFNRESPAILPILTHKPFIHQSLFTPSDLFDFSKSLH